MIVNAFPVAVVILHPKSRVKRLTRDRLARDRVEVLYRADVCDTRRLSLIVQDVDARINHVDAALAASRHLGERRLRYGSVVEIKLLESFTFSALYLQSNPTPLYSDVVVSTVFIRPHRTHEM